MSAARTPSIEDMDIAAEWLDCNEGEDGEGDACARVAEWLRVQAAAKSDREAAKAAGVNVGHLRGALAKVHS